MMACEIERLRDFQSRAKPLLEAMLPDNDFAPMNWQPKAIQILNDIEE